MPYTQAQRPFAFSGEIGEDVLLLTGFNGSEWVSRPYVFTLDLISENKSISPSSVLGKWANVKIVLPGSGERFIHGFISRFGQLNFGDGVTVYRAELVPRLWFLSLISDCRIFQK